jgi:hypothetical protein
MEENQLEQQYVKEERLLDRLISGENIPLNEIDREKVRAP